MNKVFLLVFALLYCFALIDSAYADGGVMAISGFKFSQSEILSVKNIVITVVAIVISLFLITKGYSWFKAWDERCYAKDPDAVADIDKGINISLTEAIVLLLIGILFVIIGGISGLLGFVCLIILSIILEFIRLLISKFVISVLKIKSSSAKNFVYKCSQFLIVIAIMGILAVMAMPTPSRHSRWIPRQKACYSNIRVLQGAVEMYNMDSSELMKDLDIKKLEGYIKNPDGIKCPGYGDVASYTSLGDLSKDGEVSCGDEPVGATVNDQNSKKYHGTLSGSIPTSK